MAWNKIHFETIDSTNSYALRELKNLPNHSVIIADVQTKGRGQFDRLWHSAEKENLYFSLVLKPEIQPEKIPELALLTAEKIVSVLKKYIPAKKITIKLPNDILVEGKKICGILIETKIGKTVEGIIIGIGLNLNLPPEIAKKIDQPATGLKQETTQSIQKAMVLKELLDRLPPYNTQTSACPDNKRSYSAQS
jgi:BirA family transcriptional regulator, biotin operon repressor / biotin---[acetyl-CoA-carboxylase] ligase